MTDDPQNWKPPDADADANWKPPDTDADAGWKPPDADAAAGTPKKAAAAAQEPGFNWRDPNTWWPALVRNETEGVGQAVQGGKKIWSGVTGEAPEGAGRAIAGGLHDVITGGGQAIAPAALPLALPVLPEALMGMAGGAALGWGAKKGAEALQLAPEYQDLAGDVGNIIGGGLAAKGLTPRPKLASSLSPAEQAAVEWGEGKIPMDAVTRTGNPKAIAQQAETAASKTAQASQQKTQGALEFTGRALAGGPEAYPENAGAGVVEKLGETYARHGEGASKAYGELEDIEAKNVVPIVTGQKTVNTGIFDAQGNEIIRQVPIVENIGLPVDLTQAKRTLGPLREKVLQELPPSQQQLSAGLHALNGILDGPDMLSATTADRSLGAIKTLMREKNLNGRTKYLLGQALDALDPAVNDAVAKGGPNAMAALWEGRALTRAKYATKETMEALPDEPVKIFDKLTAGPNYGAGRDVNINLLRDVQQHAPDSIPALGRAYLQGLFEKSVRGMGEYNPKAALQAWTKLGSETRQILFKPDQISELNNFFQLAELSGRSPRAGVAPKGRLLGFGAADLPMMLGEAALMGAHGANPALAKVGYAAAATQMLYKFGSRGLARLMWNPSAARFLTQGWRAPFLPSSPVVGGVTGAAGHGVGLYAQGGPVTDLQRRTFDHKTAIAALTGRRDR